MALRWRRSLFSATRLLATVALLGHGGAERLALLGRGGAGRLALLGRGAGQPRAPRLQRAVSSAAFALAGLRGGARGDSELLGVLDRDMDGMVERQEYRACVVETAGDESGRVPEDQWQWYEMIFAAADVDQDEVLSPREVDHLEKLVRGSMLRSTLSSRRPAGSTPYGVLRDAMDAELEQMTTRFDEHGNELASKEEAFRIFAASSGDEGWDIAQRSGVAEWLRRALDEADADGDGWLTASEVQGVTRAVHAAVSSGLLVHMNFLSVLFDEFDLDADGYIAESELVDAASIVEKSGLGTAARSLVASLQRNFVVGDLNEDGQLDAQEALVLAERFIAGDDV